MRRVNERGDFVPIGFDLIASKFEMGFESQTAKHSWRCTRFDILASLRIGLLYAFCTAEATKNKREQKFDFSVRNVMMLHFFVPTRKNDSIRVRECRQKLHLVGCEQQQHNIESAYCWNWISSMDWETTCIPNRSELAHTSWIHLNMQYEFQSESMSASLSTVLNVRAVHPHEKRKILAYNVTHIETK